ncbi:MAG: non-structural protein 1 [Clostridium sp.]|nr:non-structural protein 1 [Bacteroides sp.]MCM1197970.1 non-structural protein 1 [Clostridium sp.]
MKNIFTQQVFLTVLIIAIVSCDTDKGHGTVEQQFAIEYTTLDWHSVSAHVNPTLDGESHSYYMCLDKKEFVEEQWNTDDKFIDHALQIIEGEAVVNHQTTEEYLRGVLKNGKSEISSDYLDIDTDYYLSIFGLEPDGTVTTGVTRSLFHTPVFTPTEKCKYTIEGTIIQSNALTISIEPSNKNIKSYVYIIEESVLEQQYENIYQLIRLILLYNNEDYWNNHANNIFTSKYVNTFSYLKPGTAYVILAYGINEKGEPITEITTARFSTADGLDE